MDLIQKKKKKTLLLCKRSCDDDEKISHRLGENICKPHRRIKNSKNATVKKKKASKEFGSKMGKRAWTFGQDGGVSKGNTRILSQIHQNYN